MTIDLQVPDSWENHSIHTFLSPHRKDDFAGNITVARGDVEDQVSLERLVDLTPVPEDLDDLLVTATGYKTKGVIRYHERTYKFVEPQQGLLLQQTQRLVILKRNPYVLTYTGPADDFEAGVAAFGEVFDRVVEESKAGNI